MLLGPEPARTEELAPAFRLLFGHLEPAERDKRVGNVLLLVQHGELNPEGVFVLRNENGIHGTLVCVPQVGATCPPQSSGRRCIGGRAATNEDDTSARPGPSTGFAHKATRLPQPSWPSRKTT